MLRVSSCLVLFTIWAARLILPSKESLITQLGIYLGDGGPYSANMTSTDIATDLTGQQPTDPNIANIDVSDADAPFIIWPLKRVCAEQADWVEGLVFVCDNNFGGIGNIRQFILVCIRYAIEAGATGLTMPRIRKRADHNIGSLFEHDIRSFNYLFDAAHFRRAMAQSCPQITLYNDDYSDIPNAHNMTKIPRVNFIRQKEGREAMEDSIDRNETVPVHVIMPKDYRCHLRSHVIPSYINTTKLDVEGTEEAGWDTEEAGWGAQEDDGGAQEDDGGAQEDDEGAQKAVERDQSAAGNQGQVEPERDNEGEDAGNGDCGEFHHHVERWGDNFRQWLFDEARIEQSKVPAPSMEKPFLVRIGKWALFEYPTQKDGAEFRNTFGQILKFNRPVMDMGKKVLGKMQNMSATLHAERVAMGLAQKAHKSTVINNDERGFLGLHLRTEADVRLADWAKYDELKHGFLAKAEEHGFQGGVAYVATGNVRDARRFEYEAREALDLKVVDKRILLADEPQALAELEAMNWDQQGLVDYVVMVASEMFVGSSRSSFSVWLCVRRAVMVDGGLHARPYRPRVNRDDGASFVVGPKEKYWADWLFFYDAIWP